MSAERDPDPREGPILVCVDGSDLSIQAAKAGLDLFPDIPPVVVVTAVEDPDPMLLTGTGTAGGVLSPEQFEQLQAARRAEAQGILDDAVAALGLDRGRQLLVDGAPGRALCALADESNARALIIGTRGRGGIKRAVLGSVSDFVVRNAPCPVIVSGPKVDLDTPTG